MDANQYAALMAKLDELVAAMRSKGAKNNSLLGRKVRNMVSWGYHEKRQAIGKGDVLEIVVVHEEKGHNYYDIMDAHGRVFQSFGVDDFEVVL